MTCALNITVDFVYSTRIFHSTARITVGKSLVTSPNASKAAISDCKRFWRTEKFPLRTLLQPLCFCIAIWKSAGKCRVFTRFIPPCCQEIKREDDLVRKSHYIQQKGASRLTEFCCLRLTDVPYCTDMAGKWRLQVEKKTNLRTQQGGGVCFWSRPPGGLTCRRFSLTSTREEGPRGASGPPWSIFNWNRLPLGFFFFNDGGQGYRDKCQAE